MKRSYTLLSPFTFLFLSSFFINTLVQAQAETGFPPPPPHSFNRCAAKQLLDKVDPLKINAFEQLMYNKAQGRTGRTSTDTVQYTVPVVFHIIHNNGPENIPDSDVWDALNLLNTAFKHAPPYNPAGGADIDIDFCLSSSAITRNVSPLTDLVMETDDAALKAISQWDATSYINIWVVNSIGSAALGPGVAGYAAMPASHGAIDDGIVIEAAYINSHPEDVAVLIHEMGHYLGLYHTFEGGCGNSDCMLNGDRVCDTPPDNSIAPVNCTGSANTCSSDSDDPSLNNPFRSIALGGLGDQPDMFRNFMDYGFQTCQNTFTDGQRTRMRDGLTDMRHSLLDHPGLCQGCTTPIIASLTIPDTLPAGVPATFNIVTSSTGLLILWQFNGYSVVGTTTTTQVFPSAGFVYIKIFVIDPAAPGCNFQMYDTVYFDCPVTPPTFSTSAGVGELLNPGDVVTFTTVDNGYNYVWTVDGAPVGSGATFNYTVAAYGQQIALEADNGTCKAVSVSSYFADPGNCANSKQNNTWYFGNSAGINFNVSPPQAIVGKITTTEGAAVLCDDNGLPVFHSNGADVGNSQTGNVLLNGSGLTGNPTTTQSALFVPMPGSNRYVYLFTLDYQAGEGGTFGGGIYYSIIDKQGDGGQGEVTVKNQLMLAPVAEKVTAVRNAAGDGIWLIAHKYGSDAFYSWPITSSGIGTPVISNTGAAHVSPPGYYVLYYAIGEMKASPLGNKLAVAISGLNMYEVFDFNKATGVLSNAVTLSSSLTPKPYGIAFSPNERFLYGSCVSGNYNVLRYDLAAGNAAAINASGVVIGSSGGALQLAPDGKIYIARGGGDYLSVISNPNAVNAADCGFVTDGFRLLGGTTSTLGLVNPIQSTVASVKPEITGPDKVCLSGSPQAVNYIIYPTGNANYTWAHHGPNAYTFVNDSSVTITYNSAGTDTLIVNRSAACGILSDTLIVHSGTAPAFSIGPDQLVCKGTAVTLNAGPGMFDYHWSNYQHTQTTMVSAAGLVYAEVITPNGCVLRDSMLLQNYTLPSLDLGNDTSICNTETVTLTAPAGMDSYLWSTGATGSSIIAADSGRFIVTVGKYGCLFKDTIIVRRDVLPDMFSTDTVTVCNGMSNMYAGSSGFDSYSWQLPSGAVVPTQSVSLSDPGYYIVTYSNHCGTGTDSIYNYVPKLFSQDTIFSCDDTVRLVSNYPLMNVINAEFVGSTFTGDTLTVFRTGYYITIGSYPTPGSGCILAQLIYIAVDTTPVRPAMSIDLGPDVSYCEGHVLPLNAGSGYDWYQWNNGSVDSSTTVYGFGQYTVTAHYCGFDFRDTIVVSNDNTVTVNLGPDILSCNPSAVILDAGSGYDTYEWSNGQTTQQINGSVLGEYWVSAGLNGCIARDSIQIIDCALAVPDAKDCTQPFYLSPNPGTDVVTLGSRCPLSNNIRLAVSSADGKVIATKEGDLQSQNVFLNQLMKDLSSSVYVISITSDTGRYYFKWMIAK